MSNFRTQIADAVAKGDVNALAELATTLLDTLEGNARTTWLTPSALAWELEMGAGTFPYGKAGKALVGLHKAGWDSNVIGERLGFYLRTQKREGAIRFLSIPRFVETFSQWDPHETVDL